MTHQRKFKGCNYYHNLAAACLLSRSIAAIIIQQQNDSKCRKSLAKPLQRPDRQRSRTKELALGLITDRSGVLTRQAGGLTPQLSTTLP